MPYISFRWPWISRVVMPRAYIEIILSSKPVQRVWRLAMILGSKVPLRSRGISSSNSPKSPFSVFWLFPLRELPVVAHRVVLLVAEMFGHLGFQGPLQHAWSAA